MKVILNYLPLLIYDFDQQEATNAGRLENFKNFRVTQSFISQVNDNVLRAEAESKAERFLYFTSTASIIQETGIKGPVL